MALGMEVNVHFRDFCLLFKMYLRLWSAVLARDGLEKTFEKLSCANSLINIIFSITSLQHTLHGKMGRSNEETE